MKIVVTTDTYWPRINGVTVSIDTFRRSLMRNGHTVYVIAPQYPQTDSEFSVPDDRYVFRLPSFKFPLSPEDRLGYPSVRLTIRRLLEELEPDIVHSNTEFTIGFGGKTYCLRNNVPHIMTCHTYYEHYITSYMPAIPTSFARTVASTWSRSDYRLIDGLVVPSRWMERLVRSYGVQCPIDVIPTGISPEEFSLRPDEKQSVAARFSKKLPGIAGRRILLYAGRIAREKNTDFLLEMMAKVKEECPEALLVLAGKGPHDARLRELVQERNLSSHVRFAGYLDRKELSYALSLAEAFVFASKTETQGLVLVEAMMCRTPVVAVRSPGTEEVVTDGRGGYLVEEDVSQFAEKVLLLLTDRELHARKRAEAWASAQNWTADAMTVRLIAVFERAIRVRRDQYADRSA
ncbi:MAG: glycosyltransferase [Spirochaetia bacterium]|jgi:glycosyltransferase involved in cell wall biosynthesis